jgi:HK97 family phage major capsid protein
MDKAANNRPWFKVAQRDDAEAELTIFDEIGGWGQTVDDFKRAVDGVKDKAKVRLLINSPGGIVTDGWAIYNILSRIREKLTVEVVGLAASMASVIALAGKELIMDRGTYLMIHEPWTFALGSSEELRKMADVMDTMKADIVRLYEERSALTHDEIISMMAAETWITADDAAEYGFANSVKETAQAAACARFDFSRYGFNRAPSALVVPEVAPLAPASPRASVPADINQEGTMDPTITQTPPAAAPAPAPILPEASEMDDRFVDMLASRIAPAVAKLIPVGRKLEAQVQDDKFPGWFLDALRGKNLERGMPRDSAAVIKTTDGFGIPIIAMPQFLANLNFYSIARRWGSQVFGAPSGSLKFTADVVQNAAAIITETGSYADKGEPASVAMTLVKVGGRYSITEEATEDSVLQAFDAFQKGAAVAIAKAENLYFLAGTGSGQPKGIFAETATKTVASASAITYAEMQAFDESLASEWDVLEEFNPLNPSAYRGPIYLMNPATAATLRALNDGGSPAKYYFQDEGARMLTIYGRPVIRDTNIPTITNSAKVIALVNFNAYVIGERHPNLALKVTENQDTHATNWDFAERIDGKLWNTAGAKILAMH